VHLIPTDAALGLVRVDPTQYQAMQRQIPVIGTTVGGALLNIDGALAVRNPTAEGTHGYSQFFRNGFLESAMVLSASQNQQHSVLPSTAYEKQLVEFLQKVRTELAHLGISTELSFMLSILRANEVKLGVSRDFGFEDPEGFFDRKTLVLPDVLTESGTPAELALKPVFDLVWQSAGFPCSRNYSAEGRWAPRR